MAAPSSPAVSPALPLIAAFPPAMPDASSPPDESPRLLRLRCGVQHYEWGLFGEASLVARLAAADPDFGIVIDPALPYAELWMGTHPSMPSLVLPGGEPLSGWLARNKDALGHAVVLSVAKPLSIQAHPDKSLAKELHDQRPADYRDANHKPEMAIAITEFRALFGFAGIEFRTLTEKELLILSLERQYPEDVGVLAALFFNYVKLSPGEAIYIGANEPHAYLSGECIECMATSDNVVRAGLTPKYRDVKTLSDMLTYKQVFPEILRGVPVYPYVRRYTPPTDEFEVDCCLLPPGEVVVMPPTPSPSIFLVMTGKGEIQVDSMLYGEKTKEGDVFFVPAYTGVKLSACGHASMQLYRAGVNSTSLNNYVG
uniref:Uncharacterized protein n=1 Tax=Avena sativa TaxID=4498 RepID=A0ACD5VL03_AVESA